MGEEGPEKSYTAVVGVNESILDEAIAAVDMECLHSEYDYCFS